MLNPGALLSGLIAHLKIRSDPVAYARGLGVTVGKDARLLAIHPGTFGTEPYLISLGDHVTITARVQFITHDGGVWVFRDKEPDIDVVGPITIGNNVFIGFGTILMPNIRIGSNVVIGAGSVVTRDIPDNCVALGAPARVYCSIEEYSGTVQAKKINLRNLAPDAKRKVLVSRFAEKQPAE